MTLSDTARRALEAYGGEARWRAATTLELELSAGGLAFRLKWQPPLVRASQRHLVHQPRVRCAGIDRRGNVGLLDGHDVRLESPAGRLLAERPGARAYFGPGRRWLWWDALDQTYFACYAAWNYFTLPALLLREDVSWREVEPGLLEARFPPQLPTHCELQRFRFDASGLLLRHDYTAEIIGGFARAARVVLQHGDAGGVAFPQRMRITPQAGEGAPPRPFPVLVQVEATRFELR